jgi:hypothetical protein
VKSSVDTESDYNSIDSMALPQTERGKRIVKDRYLKGEYKGKIV